MRILLQYSNSRVSVYRATKVSEAGLVAKHLLYPTVNEIHQTVEEAEAKGFERVILHGHKTWPNKAEGLQKYKGGFK